MKYDNDNPTEASVVADLTARAFEPRGITAGNIYAVPDGHGGVKVLDTDAYASGPLSVTASRVVRDADSLVAYLAKHGRAGCTELWADQPAARIVAVVDGHAGADEPNAWERHRATLEVVKTPAWEAWAKADGGFMPQDVFSDFIEDHAPDVREPASATMLEIARKFQANTRVDFESGHRTDNGQVRLEYKETTTAKVGQKGNIDVPTEITLALRPYLGGPAYKMTARFRYRITPGGVLLGFVLNRPADVLELAFADIVTEIREGRHDADADGNTSTIFEGVPYPIYFGRP